MTERPGGWAVRPVGDGDAAPVRALFRATIALGRPLPFDLPDLDAYERLCLDWYLGPGRDAAAVLTEGAEVRGYVLVCLDHTAYRRWAVPRALAWAARVGALLAARRYEPDAATFSRLRLADGVAAWRSAPPPPQPVAMHFNVARGARAGDAGRRLAAHVDRLCRDRGLSGWYGEVNAAAGRRAAALERLGGRVVHRQRNATLSWLTGSPVERLTVERPLDRAAHRPPVRTGPGADAC